MTISPEFTIALIRALVGGILTAGATFLTTWGVADVDPNSKVVIVATCTTFVGYITLRFGAEGWIDTAASSKP